MKRILSALVLIAFCAAPAFASDDYIYRQKVNWVKFTKVPKELQATGMTHPYTAITADQMEGMLRSIKIDQRYLLKKDIETTEVFNSWEARKFAPLFVEALAKAQADQVVNFAIIHKRPLFLLQNDKLSTGNLWVSADGIHIRFSRLFAKIDGDYESSVEMDKSIRRSKTMRVSLDSGPGQKLSYNGPMEIILDPAYDFVSATRKDDQIQLKADEEELKPKDKRAKAAEDKKVKAAKTAATIEEKTIPAPASNSTNTAGGSSAERLKKLDDLKKQKLISDKEYQELRKKILSDL